jgi:hypothetical protein
MNNSHLNLGRKSLLTKSLIALFLVVSSTSANAATTTAKPLPISKPTPAPTSSPTPSKSASPTPATAPQVPAAKCSLPNCFDNNPTQTFPGYGNSSSWGGTGDCVLAAAADWITLTKGIQVAPNEVARIWIVTGHSQTLTGYNIPSFFDYWKKNPFAGFTLGSYSKIGVDQNSIQQNVIAHKAIYVSLLIKPNTALNLGPNAYSAPQKSAVSHAVVVDGFTPTGPVVVTWGQTLHITWATWNQFAADAWVLTVS